MDPFLHARWIEGEGSGWSFVLKFPVLVRRHSDDTPILPEMTYGSSMLKQIIEQINEKVESTIVTGSTGLAGEEHFPLYREPNTLTQEEGLIPQLRCSLINVSGARTIADLTKLQELIADTFSENIKKEEKYFTICVGIPSLIPLSGHSSGNVIRLDSSPLSLLLTPSGKYSEREFFSLDNSYWTSITDARVTEADDIRLYSDSLDVCINITHVSQASRAQIRTNRALRLNSLAAWRLSKFALISADPASWNNEEIPPPDESIKWPWNDSWFCGWYHETLLGGLISLPTAFPEVVSMRSMRERTEEERLTKIGKVLENLDIAEMVDSTKARHMLASISYDPFEEEGDSLFRTAELSLEEESGLPSPILPARRNFSATIFMKTSPLAEFERVTSQLIVTFSSIGVEYCVEQSKDYFRIDFDFKLSSIVEQSTSEILDELYQWFRTLFGLSNFTDIKNNICTKLVWKELTGVSLGVPWYKSENVYVTIPDIDGVRELRGIDNPLKVDWKVPNNDET